MQPNGQQVAARRSRVLMSNLGAPIADALRESAVVEVIANPDGRLWVERIGRGREATDHRLTPAQSEAVIRLVASHMGEMVNDQAPMIAGVLPEGGERFQGVLPPLSRAPCFTIRKRPEVIYPLADYVAHGIMTAAYAEVLRTAVAERRNILIAGGTGSGKTTLANALLAEPAFSNERVVIIEDTPELQCAAPDRVELLTKRTPPPVTMTELVRMTMRLRPDRIVIGEVRGAEALDMLKAMNTGHPGGLTTVHANSAHDALLRLEDLVREAVHDVPRRTIAAAIDMIVFIERAPAGRKVSEVARVSLDPNGGYRLEPVA